MRKSNISAGISYNQYKLMDIMLFMVIMTALEAVNVFAVKKWFPAMLFSVSLMFTVSLIVLIRWNFLAAFFPALNGILYCAFLNVFGVVPLQTYVIYAVGNSFLLLSWFIFKLIPREKLFGKWYFTIIYPAVAFILVIFGRTAVAACFGENFLITLGAQVQAEALNAVFALMALLVLRKFDGMLEDQKTYLTRVARRREEAKTPKEEAWAGYTELDEEELKKLYSDEKSEEGDGISMYDEYPPDSR